MEQKLTVVAKDGQVLIGNHFHTLTDESKNTFSSRNLGDFRVYCMAIQGDFEIFYNGTKIEAWPIARDRNAYPIAVCELQPSPFLECLSEVLGDAMTTAEFELFIRAMVPCLNTEGLPLLDIPNQLKVSKIVSMEMSKDNAGNYNYLYKRESNKGGGDFTPPKEIVFTVPIFDFSEKKASFKCNFFFNYTETPEGVRSNFQLQSLMFKAELEAIQRKIILEELAAFEKPAYQGTMSITKADDTWKYLSNGIRS